MNGTREPRWRESGRSFGMRDHVLPAGRRHGATRRGFTLLELLLAFALLALMATVLIGGSSQWLSQQPESADDIFWKAVAGARKTALLSGRDVRLAFADDREKGRRFTVSSAEGELATFPVATADDLAVNFLSGQKTAGSAVILAGQVVETESLKHVTFYADGTCTPFRVQIRSGVDAHILSLDPWTCAQVLVPVDPFAR